MKCFVIKIYGIVQAVGFRYSAKLKAKELNITGIVRNEPDGSVYIEAEGEEENLMDFLKWCYKGPRFSKVEKVDCQDKEPSGNFNDFRIV